MTEAHRRPSRPGPARSPRDSEVIFWRTHVHTGVVLFALGALGVLAYVVATPSAANRDAMTVLGVSSLVLSLVFWGTGLRLVATRWRMMFLTGWSAYTFAVIAAVAILDGGTRSPLSYLLVLPLLFAGLAYSAGAVFALAVFGVAAAVTVGAATSHPSWSTTVVIAFEMVIAGLLTTAVARNRTLLNARLIESATHDDLTGCLTRRAFHDRIDAEARRAGRYGGTFSVILADLDELKAANDRGGHEVGDQALVTLAQTLTQAARGTDMVGRLGGDEFALLLPETNGRHAEQLMERLRAVLHDGGDLRVTASFGISHWLGIDDSRAGLLRRADQALYLAKRSGRDRVVCWDSTMGSVISGSLP